MVKKRLRGKKKLMIEALKSELGVVTAACEKVSISRETHYNWRKTDENYKEEAEAILDMILDFAENSLYKQINKGNTVATIFLLKTKGKNRGYVEKQEIEHSGGVKQFTIIEVIEDGKNKDENVSKTE